MIRHEVHPVAWEKAREKDKKIHRNKNEPAKPVVTGTEP